MRQTSTTRVSFHQSIGEYYFSKATGINDSGQIAGNTGDTAVIWTPNGAGGYTSTTLGVDLGSTIGSGDAMGINNAGTGVISQVYNSYRAGYSTGASSLVLIGEEDQLCRLGETTGAGREAGSFCPGLRHQRGVIFTCAGCA